jgi:hypothetical protein
MQNPKNFTKVTVTTADITRTYPLVARMNPNINRARRQGQAEVTYIHEGQAVTAVLS